MDFIIRKRHQGETVARVIQRAKEVYAGCSQEKIADLYDVAVAVADWSHTDDEILEHTVCFLTGNFWQRVAQEVLDPARPTRDSVTDSIRCRRPIVPAPSATASAVGIG